MGSEKPKPELKVEVQSVAQVTPPADPNTVSPSSHVPPLAAGAQGINETLEQSMYDKLMSTTWEQTLSADQFSEYQKGTEADASAWMFGPARLQILAVADRRLAKCANRMNLETTPIEHIERLHARLIPGTSYMVVRPAAKGDLSATPVKRYDSGAFANLSRLVGQTQFRVESGWKERYAVAYIPKGSPLGEGIVINLSAPLERRQVRKEEEEETE